MLKVLTAPADTKRNIGVRVVDPASKVRHQWRSRRFASLSVRMLILLVPILVAVISSMLLGRFLPKASGFLTWIRILAIIVGSSVAMIRATALMQRFLPLAVLFKASLVFPDVAPSRFNVALRRRPSDDRVRDPQLRGPSGPTDSGNVEVDDDGSLLNSFTDESPSAVTAELADLLRRLSRHHRLTRGHSERVRAYAELIAEEMKLPESDRIQMRWAALLHDIGKLTVPVDVLDLPGKPNADQWKFIADHPSQGELLAQPVASWLGPWAPGIWEHHEKFDGTGYPKKLAGTEISLAGRIVALADAFETMTAIRSYKKSMTIEAARAEVVACAGKHFDPDVVRSFIRVGIDPLKGVVGMSALLQVPLLILDQLGGIGKLLARTGSAGAVASVAVVSGAAGDVSAKTDPPPVVAAVMVPVTTTESPTTTTTVLVTLSAPESPPVTVVVLPTPEPTTTTEEPTTSTTQPPSRPARTTTTTTTEPPAPTTTTTTTTLPPTTTTTAPATTTTTEPPTTTTTVAPTTTTLPLPVLAANDSFDVTNGVSQTISPLANDTGPIDVTTFALTGSSPGVSATSNGDGTVTVSINGGPTSRRTLSYRICSAAGDCSTATITFRIV
jgi:HD domain